LWANDRKGIVLLEFVITIVSLAAAWRIYQKMGRQGWEGIIPIYNSYVLFEELYGNGWKMLLMLIPLFNIYLGFKVNIELAKRFHQSTGFGVGLVFLYPIFASILAFGNAIYEDGSRAQNGSDPISETIDTATGFVSDAFSGKPRKDPEALKKLEQLKTLLDSGVLSEEEYNKLKADLLERV